MQTNDGTLKCERGRERGTASLSRCVYMLANIPLFSPYSTNDNTIKPFALLILHLHAAVCILRSLQHKTVCMNSPLLKTAVLLFPLTNPVAILFQLLHNNALKVFAGMHENRLHRMQVVQQAPLPADKRATISGITDRNEVSDAGAQQGLAAESGSKRELSDG